MYSDQPGFGGGFELRSVEASQNLGAVLTVSGGGVRLCGMAAMFRSLEDGTLISS